MDLKKILLITILAVTVFSCMAAVSAESVTVDGTTFNVPSGFSKDTNMSNKVLICTFIPTEIKNPDLNNIKTFTDGKNIVGITVQDAGNHDLNDFKRDAQNDTEKTISGKSGLLGETRAMDQDGNVLYELVVFKYIENGKLYIIVAPDEATVEKIIS